MNFLLKRQHELTMIMFPSLEDKSFNYNLAIKFILSHKIFSWKLVSQKLPIKIRLMEFGCNIYGDCPFYHQVEGDIDHIFKNCDIVRLTWTIIDMYCPSPLNSQFFFVDWLDHIRQNKIWYNKFFHHPLEKNLIIAWT